MVWNNLVPTVDTGTTLSTKLNAWAASVETRLTGASHYVGAKDVTAPIGAYVPAVGDYVIVNKDGTIDASWAGAAGQVGAVGDALFFDGTNWDLIGTKYDFYGKYSEVFDTVADMKAADLAVGALVATKGFNTIGDGRGANYIINSSGAGDLLNNGKVASRLSYTSKQNIDQLPSKVAIGHRGMSATNADNLIEAFSSIIDYCAGVEFDVQPASDDTLYVFHNANVDGVTDGTGAISSKTKTQVESLKITLLQGTPYEDEKILELDNLLNYFSGLNKIFFLEITQTWTTAQLKLCVDKVRIAGLLGRVIFHGGTTPYLQAIKSYEGNAMVCITKTGNLATLTSTIDALYDMGGGIVGLAITNFTAEAAQFKKYCDDREVKIMAFTAQDKTMYLDALKAGADFVLVDNIMEATQ